MKWICGPVMSSARSRVERTSEPGAWLPPQPPSVAITTNAISQIRSSEGSGVSRNARKLHLCFSSAQRSSYFFDGSAALRPTSDAPSQNMDGTQSAPRSCCRLNLPRGLTHQAERDNHEHRGPREYQGEDRREEQAGACVVVRARRSGMDLPHADRSDRLREP